MNVFFDAIKDCVAMLEKGAILTAATASQVGCRVLGSAGGGEEVEQGIAGGPWSGHGRFDS